MHYEWDPKKAKSNLKRHGVSFEEAALALETDPNQQIDPDLDHDDDRMRVLAASPNARILFIVIVERDEDTTRIISARKATTAEQIDYAERQDP